MWTREEGDVEALPSAAALGPHVPERLGELVRFDGVSDNEIPLSRETRLAIRKPPGEPRLLPVMLPHFHEHPVYRRARQG